MEFYSTLAEHYGLDELTTTVSSMESNEQEIWSARVSESPILITSPLFSLGINFAFHPETLWVSVGRLDVDTNQIIQSVNRANRSALKCEVRLYAYRAEPSQESLPSYITEKLKIESYFLREDSLKGVLEMHTLVDRVTYLSLRKLEKNTAAALDSLIKENNLQNYTITNFIDQKSTPDDAAKAFLKDIKEIAKAKYSVPFNDAISKFPVKEDWQAMLYIERLMAERNDFRDKEPRLKREVETDVLAVVNNYCEVSTMTALSDTDIRSLQRLNGEFLPYLSSQYYWKNNPDWGKVAAFKVAKISRIVECLSQLGRGDLSMGELCLTLRRSKGIREGILALVSNEGDFIYMSKRFEKLRSLCNKARESKTRKNMDAATNFSLELLIERFRRWGIGFKKDDKGKYDYSQPTIPRWDFETMCFELNHLEAILKKYPARMDLPIFDGRIRPEHKEEDERHRLLCEDCVFFKSNRCVKGIPVEWQEGYSPIIHTNQCDELRKVPAQIKDSPLHTSHKFY